MQRHKVFPILIVVVSLVILGGCAPFPDSSVGSTVTDEAVPAADPASQETASDEWVSDFDISPEDLSTTGRSPFFILEPGYQLVLEGGDEKVIITVLDRTVEIGPFTTRVLEEREWVGGELREISYNYYAISKTTGDVFYFGEEVDMYDNGVVVEHTGAWLAFQRDAKPGLIMPGNPLVGYKHYQEIAPGQAMDRAEVKSLDISLSTPAGEFDNCLQTLETTPLNPLERGTKTYAPGVGLIQDERLLLVDYGYVEPGG
jgi:hypothetical protein